MGIKYNDSQKALIAAARSGDEAALRQLTADGFEVDCELKYGSSALMIAASRGHVGAVRTLVAAGAKVNRRNRFGATALMEACEKGHHDVARALVELGADVNMPHNNGTTVLLAATFRRDVKTIKILLELGADPEIENFDGWTAGRWAKSEANKDLMDVLGMEKQNENTEVQVSLKGVETEAAPQKQTTIISGNDTFWTAFMRAASAGDINTVRRLAEDGVEVNGQSPNGTTALIAAAKNGQKDTVFELIELGADLNIADGAGLTAIDWASKNGQALIANSLRERVSEEPVRATADDDSEKESRRI